MFKDSQSYELVDRGIDPSNNEPHQQDNGKSTANLLRTQETYEKPNVVLERSIRPLLFSFLWHILPTLATIAIVSLSFSEVYWFDSDSSTDKVPIRGTNISLNELLNLLQFVAKIHEILLVGSIGAMVMHRVRVRLLGNDGLPLGMLTGGYSVGSAEYLFSSAFRSGFSRPFWSLSILIFVFTVLANTFGPASAIALVPSLDWWEMKKPFGGETLPVLFDVGRDKWWPLEITKDLLLVSDSSETLPNTTCILSAEWHEGCPASGYDELVAWTSANANEAVFANLSITDQASPAQRVIKSRLTDQYDTIPGVAIATSVSHTMMTVLGTFWNQVTSRDFPVNNVVRAKLELPQNEMGLQPLVQVHCIPNLLDDIKAHSNSRNASVSGFDINTFSIKNASNVKIPDWLFEFDYKPQKSVWLDEIGKVRLKSENATNITWVQYPKDSGFDQSIVAMVTTPIVIKQHQADTGTSQSALVHVCSVDARWIASEPTYDPTEDTVIAHNISDPLLFRRSKTATESTYKTDVAKWGISPSLKLSTDWAEALNIPNKQKNTSASSLELLLNTYLVPISNNGTDNSTSKRQDLTNDTISLIFDVGAKNQNFLAKADAYAMAASETVATLLSLQITDALARIHVSDAQNAFVVLNNINDTHVRAARLNHLAGILSTINGSAVSVSLVEEALPTGFTFKVSRYGYGYGFRTATIYFGVMVLLAHSLLTIVYIMYALYEFFYVKHWTSNSWGSIGELMVLLINSKPSTELQNTCAGIDSKMTWRKRVYIRETGDAHVGVVVGELDPKVDGLVKVGMEYGTLEKERTGIIKRRRGVSI